MGSVFIDDGEIDENLLAVSVAEEEGGAVSLNIAQIKEVQRILLDRLGYAWAKYPGTVVELLRKREPVESAG